MKRLISLSLLLFIFNSSFAQEVYGVFGLPSGDIGKKQVGTVNPTSGAITLLGTSTSVDSSTLAMTTGATALNVAGNKSYFIGRDSMNVDRIYTVDLDTGITDTNPALSVNYTTSTNFGIWYDEPAGVLYALFGLATNTEIAVINPSTGIVTTHDSSVVAQGTPLGSGLLTGDSIGERIFLIADDALVVVSTAASNSHFAIVMDDFGFSQTASSIFGLEWDKSTDSLWALYNAGGGRSLAQIGDDLSDGGEPAIFTNIEIDFGDSIATSSGLSALDVQSSQYFFFGRPSSGANANKWSMYTVDLINQTSTNVNIENAALVQTNGYAGIEVLPGPELSFSKSDGGASTTPGSVLTYTLSYSNAPGTGATSGLKITETVPAETTFLPANSTAGWSCTPNNTAGSSCEISPGELGPGSNSSVTFVLQVDAFVAALTTDISNSATLSANNATTSEMASDTTPITATAILSVTKTDNGITNTVPGDTISYDISASNTGDRIASNTVLSDTVPLNTTFNSGMSAGWSCVPDNNSGSSCTNTIGSLAAPTFNSTFVVNVIASVPAGATQVSNTVTLSADNASSDLASDTTPITSSAILTLSKDDGGAIVTPSSSVVYQLDYANTGNQDAAATTIVETVLAETIFDASNSTVGWSCVPDVLPVSICTYSIGTVGGASNGSINFALQLNNPVSDAISELANTATLDANNATAVMAQDNTPIEASVNLRMVKTDGNVTAALSKVINYTLIHFNDGDRNAVDVVLTETVPDNTVYYPPSSSPGWVCLPDNSATSTCTYDVGALAGSAKNIVFFAVKVNEPLNPAVTELSNTASIVASNAQNSVSDTELTPVDSIVPTISLVDANPSITEIFQCSQNDEIIDQIFISFNDDNSGMIGVDDMNNYLLIDTGADQDLQSSNCNTLLGDDISIAINSLTLGGTPTNPNVILDFINPIEEGLYILMVCDDIIDAAGNALDGNGDGDQGDNMIRQFRIEHDNLFANAYLDDCVDAPIVFAPWIASTNKGTIVDVTATTDTNASSLSGSIELTHMSGDGSVVSAKQCVNIPDVQAYTLGANVLGSATQVGDLDMTILCEFSDVTNCANIIDTHSESFTLASSVTPIWLRFESLMLTPVNTLSIACSVNLSSPSMNSFTNYLDNLEFRDADLIFKNSFEFEPITKE